ncbi:hypothetical protein LXT21_01820 [Myxococcus sp. K38C18041901]|uniref:hypothetical protein n=1 Tax=Myxococcus guangdongensis TaxID=2906760 RepID=UPI0020A836D6|nr:hypothetical protein [Myxococcus guangdongensis]MCP3057510.1 hypothetical protein [Myxococcus guangdongensis]
MKPLKKVLMGTFLLTLVFFLFIGQSWVLQVPFLLAFGWLGFLQSVGPSVTFRWGAIGEALLVAGILAVGSHLFLRWLWRQLQAEAGAWRVRWSVSLLLLLVLFFGATMAAVGIGHHVGWLMAGREDLVRSSWPRWRMERAWNSRGLCHAALARLEAGTPLVDIPRALLLDPETRAPSENLYVVSRVEPGGETGFMVFARDPLALKNDGGVRCSKTQRPDEVESLDAEAVARWRSGAEPVVGSTP